MRVTNPLTATSTFAIYSLLNVSLSPKELSNQPLSPIACTIPGADISRFEAAGGSSRPHPLGSPLTPSVRIRALRPLKSIRKNSGSLAAGFPCITRIAARPTPKKSPNTTAANAPKTQNIAMLVSRLYVFCTSAWNSSGICLFHVN
jgi:hypothetical protein